MKLCLLTMLLSVVSVCSFSQKITNADFAYPTKPGDGKWEKMNSVAERIASLQIPESIISEIPTERILDINPGIYVVRAIIGDKAFTFIGKIFKR